MEYTPIRRFYACIGFGIVAVVLTLGTYNLLQWVVYAQTFINASY